MQQDNTNRWIIVFAAILINLCLGSIYAWSIIASNLRIENPAWSMSDISTIFSITIFVYAITLIFAGFLQDKIGPRWVTTAGGLLLGIGLIMSGKSSSLNEIYFWHGVIGGMGLGAAYVAPIATVLKWFPEKRGLIAGIVMGAFGAGALVFGPFIGFLLNETNSVSKTLLILGILFIFLITISAQTLKNPSSNFNIEKKSISNPSNQLNPIQMLGKNVFYLCWLIFLLASIAGLTLLSNTHEVAKLFAGLSANAAISVVGLISIFNSLGSPFFGALSDRIGRNKSLFILMTISGISLLLLPLSNDYLSFVFFASLILLCFGGLFGIFPTVIADNFGTKYLGVNYGLFFTAYGLAAIIGPNTAAFLADAARSSFLSGEATEELLRLAAMSGFSTAFTFAAVCAFIGALLSLFIKEPFHS